MRNDLPEICLSTLPSTGELIVLKRGEVGYTHSDWDTDDRARNKEIASRHNREHGITPAQAEAMIIGSMLGFDAPGADPQFYFDKAFPLGALPLGSHSILDDSTGAFYKHVHGNLLWYLIDGEKCCYLELSVIPEVMMGAKGKAVLLPDLIEGKPLVPVSFSDDREKQGLIRMSFESGAFTFDKESVAGYQIAAKVRVGPVEYAMGERYGKFPSFATWERTPGNDGGGEPNYYWGHYFESRNEALRDFCDRAGEKYKELAEDRKARGDAQAFDQGPAYGGESGPDGSARRPAPAGQEGAVMELENKRQIAGQAFPPVYPHDGIYALAHGEIDQRRASLREHIACRDAIDKIISEDWDGMHISGEAAKSVLADFGAERVSLVLAATILSRPGDERFSGSNRAWAATFSNPDVTGEFNFRYASRSHSTKVDSFVSLARKESAQEMETAREARRDERKPSIKAQLAAAKASQPEKPAAKQHKQEKEAR